MYKKFVPIVAKGTTGLKNQTFSDMTDNELEPLFYEGQHFEF
jgi:hypothetical protein